MGDQRTFVTFEASLPDDVVFAESGDIGVPGGRNICEKLVESMRSEGITVSEPEQREFYGWEFKADLVGEDTWMLLQRTEPWLLIIENRSGKSGWFRKAQEPSTSSLKVLHDILIKAPEFSSILWFTRSEFEAGSQIGNPTP